jgi:hypothetical protein
MGETIKLALIFGNYFWIPYDADSCYEDLTLPQSHLTLPFPHGSERDQAKTLYAVTRRSRVEGP